MEIRKYKPGEEQEIWHLFFQTVHEVNSKVYTQQQINAWAPKNFENIAVEKIISIAPYVAIIDNKIVGYADLQENGYIDHFFCHSQYQRKGIGRSLINKVKEVASSKGITTLSADVSITARPFFESQGFSVTTEQRVTLRGQELKNYKMMYII